MTQLTPACKECGATTPQEAKARCIRTTAKDTCHGCELWPDEIAFDAPKPLTVEGVQALANEPPLIDTLALIGKVHCWPPSAVSITHTLAEEILRHRKPPQPPPPPSTEKLFHELDQLLDGIDRRVDHPEGGWWETVDGARFGKIMLRKIKETISRHLRP